MGPRSCAARRRRWRPRARPFPPPRRARRPPRSRARSRRRATARSPTRRERARRSAARPVRPGRRCRAAAPAAPAARRRRRPAQLLVDRGLGGLVLALAEVKPAQRPALAPEEQRRPAAAAVVVPELVAGVVGDGVSHAQRLQGRRELLGLGAERVARRVEAERRQAAMGIAVVPGDQVGHRPDAVQLREVEEVDEHGARGGELRHPRRAVGVEPPKPPGKLRGRDVRSLRVASTADRRAAGRPRYAGRSGRGRVSVREETDLNESTWKRIERSRARWDVLRHPFYVRWSNGELTREELARYSGQYRHAVEAIAEISASVAEALPERSELRRHAAEELGHVRLWDGFVEESGGTAADRPTTETAECVRAWTAPGSTAELLVRLYAIESGQPQISRTKREGLLEPLRVRRRRRDRVLPGSRDPRRRARRRGPRADRGGRPTAHPRTDSSPPPSRRFAPTGACSTASSAVPAAWAGPTSRSGSSPGSFSAWRSSPCSSSCSARTRSTHRRSTAATTPQKSDRALSGPFRFAALDCPARNGRGGVESAEGCARSACSRSAPSPSTRRATGSRSPRAPTRPAPAHRHGYLERPAPALVGATLAAVCVSLIGGGASPAAVGRALRPRWRRPSARRCTPPGWSPSISSRSSPRACSPGTSGLAGDGVRRRRLAVVPLAMAFGAAAALARERCSTGPRCASPARFALPIGSARPADSHARAPCAILPLGPAGPCLRARAQARRRSRP